MLETRISRLPSFVIINYIFPMKISQPFLQVSREKHLYLTTYKSMLHTYSLGHIVNLLLPLLNSYSHKESSATPPVSNSSKLVSSSQLGHCTVICVYRAF